MILYPSITNAWLNLHYLKSYVWTLIKILSKLLKITLKLELKHIPCAWPVLLNASSPLKHHLSEYQKRISLIRLRNLCIKYFCEPNQLLIAQVCLNSDETITLLIRLIIYKNNQSLKQKNKNTCSVLSTNDMAMLALPNLFCFWI